MKKAAKETPEIAPAAGASVDQIRDIIFGTQMAEYESRFGELEKRLLAESKALRDEIRKGFAEMEERQSESSQKHDEAANELGKSLETRAKELSQNAMRDREALENSLADARHDIMKRLDELTAAKTDRSTLSELLHDVAAQLENGAASTPSPKSKK